MNTGNRQFRLPGKVDSYLAILNRLYERKDEVVLREIVVNGIVSIHEEWDYDNWNGGTFGHAITFTVLEDLFVKVMEYKNDLQDRIEADINKLVNIQDEHISAVFIEMAPPASNDWRMHTGVYRPHIPAVSIPAEALQRIWNTQHVRIFLSHKSSVKEKVSSLKFSLARCGIAAFVAHEDIEPTEEWQIEIERALFSMDALVALLTEDYHDSKWTDQEVGAALGRGVPQISIRLGLDPYGLMGKKQGLGGCDWSDTNKMAAKIFQLLYKLLPDKSRLFECALSAYATSESFALSAWKIEHLLSLFDTLSSDQVMRVVETYRKNSQNRNSFKGMNILQPLLEKWTSKKWGVVNNELILINQTKQTQDREIPF